MQFVVVLDVDERILDGDDSIENACSNANKALRYWQGTEDAEMRVRPLSEVIAA